MEVMKAKDCSKKIRLTRPVMFSIIGVVAISSWHFLNEPDPETSRIFGSLQKVQAMGSLADDAFAVCTVPIDGSIEGFFILDFETGDLSGAVLNQNTSKFAASYKKNVLVDLGFKPGQAKNPKFLLVSGVADLRRGRGGVNYAQSVLYVTDSSTGATVVYGIPWNPQQAQVGTPFVAELILLDKANPRGG